MSSNKRNNSSEETKNSKKIRVIPKIKTKPEKKESVFCNLVTSVGMSSLVVPRRIFNDYQWKLIRTHPFMDRDDDLGEDEESIQEFWELLEAMELWTDRTKPDGVILCQNGVFPDTKPDYYFLFTTFS